MVEAQATHLDAVFHALGDATRRQMLRRLADGERTVGQLAEPFAMSLAAASKHIKALEAAGLIRREVQGRIHLCHLNPGPLSEADDWLRYYERFWRVRLDRLEELLRGGGGSTPARAVPPASRTASRKAAAASPTPSTTKPKRSRR